VTVAFSTSSPQASVALISEGGDLLWTGADLSPHSASAALPRLLAAGLQTCELTLNNASGFAVDLGPGSFTGVRVGIVFAKVLAYGQRVQVSGATSFDLIDPARKAYVPSRRGEVFVRVPGESPARALIAPSDAIGYEYGSAGQFPEAGQFAPLLASLTFVEPELLLPAYFAEPSVSLPKRPYAERRG
jgi:tRNA threonylcarbamoyl adenosine modification protein YeaZ